jgi:hypothetical protein
MAPRFYVNHNQAAHLIQSGQALPVDGTPNLRKTHKYERLEKDEKVFAGRPLAVLGLSAKLGPYLAAAYRRREAWAEVMVANIRTERSQGSEVCA